MPNWNGRDAENNNLPNHESNAGESVVSLLIGQSWLLEGIKHENYIGVPRPIDTFSKLCLYGTKKTYVVKGIHQRWKNKDGVALPHIRVRFSYSLGRNSVDTVVDLHIMLSQQLVPNTVSQHRDAGEAYVACCWKTVGITAVKYKVDDKGRSVSDKSFNELCRWPAQISQENNWIQEEWPRPRRRLSVGCFPPPDVPITWSNG